MAHEQWIRNTERGQAASANTVAHAPDFVRHDRGPDDDNCRDVVPTRGTVLRRGRSRNGRGGQAHGQTGNGGGAAA